MRDRICLVVLRRISWPARLGGNGWYFSAYLYESSTSATMKRRAVTGLGRSGDY